MRRAPACVLALVVAALAAGPARAATYAVQTCANGSPAGWTHFNLGDWSSVGNGCGVAGAGLSAEIDAPAWSTAGWRFTAPADTEIAGFRVTRSYWLAANRPYGTAVYSLTTAGSGRDYGAYDVNYGGARSVPPATEAASGLTGQTALSVHVDCAGDLGCTGRSGLVVYDARLDLSDDAAPAITAMSGTLLAPGPLAGTRALSYAATDRGSGLLRARLLVDGQAVAEGPLDAAAAACSGPPFAAVVPCPLSASGTLALDTRRLTEGRHELQLVVFDATGVNKAVHGPVEVLVDNVPPPSPVSAPRLAGTAREGETLVAVDGEWTGAGLTLARRWQRLEDGAWEDVDGAGGVAYTVAAADVGRRLRVRVRASNGEGAAEAASAPTAVVAGLAAATPPPAPGPVVPAPVAVPAPADERAVLRAVFESAGRSATTLRWGESRRIAGTLRRPGGQPIAGARIAVTSLARVASAAPVPLPAATTDGDGRFTYTLRQGVSRTLMFAYAAARATVAARVIGHVILRARRSGAVVRLSGRIPGTPAGLRKRVELQVRHGTTWRTFTTTRLKATGGRFAYHHRTRATRFRAVIRAEPGWPFLTASTTARSDPTTLTGACPRRVRPVDHRVGGRSATAAPGAGDHRAWPLRGREAGRPPGGWSIGHGPAPLGSRRGGRYNGGVIARPPLPAGPYLVVGLARSGVAAALALRARGEAVTATDSRTVDPPVRETLLAAGAVVRDGEPGTDLVDGARTVVKSPGVPREAPVVAAALERGLTVMGELELGWRLLEHEFVAVTGSNGKTTTVELLGHVHRRAGLPVVVAGNVGTALASLPGTLEPGTVVVCEASSFQLEDTVAFAPEAAVLLNLAEDHLDRHHTLANYRDAKLRVFAHQPPGAIAVVPAGEEFAGVGSGGASRVTFGPGGDLSERDGRLVWRGFPFMEAAEIRLPGAHNRENAMAAAAVALARGIDAEAVRAGLATFAGVPHRLETVATLEGVAYVNDSKATNVASAAVGIGSFARGVHLIAGGSDKGSDYAPLVPQVAAHAAAVYLIGETAPALRAALLPSGVALHECGDLERALAAAAVAARPGDTVLLSPGCASYDQYRSYEERGDHFRTLVAQLA